MNYINLPPGKKPAMHTGKFLSALIILLIGMAVLTTQVAQPLWAATTVQQEDNRPDKEHNKDTRADAPELYNPVINSAPQINLHLERYQIREIVLNEVADPHPVTSPVRLTESKHFRTLFRKVISTNAP